jgi:hypothetical protein
VAAVRGKVPDPPAADHPNRAQSRHFPTREDLITGTYVREVGLLTDGLHRAK